MPRKYIDCRESPSKSECSIAISADSEQELIEAAVQHACAVHGHTDSTELRREIGKMVKTGMPPETLAHSAPREPESVF